VEYQIDTRRILPPVVRIGQNNNEIGIFRTVSTAKDTLKGEIHAVKYEMKFPLHWNETHYNLISDDKKLARAKRKDDLHAFEVSRPFLPKRRVSFDLDINAQRYWFIPEDRWGRVYTLYDGEDACGVLALRNYDASQQDTNWQGDLTVPDDWPPQIAAFTAWLALEGRHRMDNW
jgi:hypothetical protein